MLSTALWRFLFNFDARKLCNALNQKGHDPQLRLSFWIGLTFEVKFHNGKYHNECFKNFIFPFNRGKG